jgi:hypothetical protein
MKRFRVRCGAVPDRATNAAIFLLRNAASVTLLLCCEQAYGAANARFVRVSIALRIGEAQQTR